MDYHRPPGPPCIVMDFHGLPQCIRTRKSPFVFIGPPWSAIRVTTDPSMSNRSNYLLDRECHGLTWTCHGLQLTVIDCHGLEWPTMGCDAMPRTATVLHRLRKAGMANRGLQWTTMGCHGLPRSAMENNIDYLLRVRS